MYTTSDLVEAFTELEQAAPTTLLARPVGGAAQVAMVQFVTCGVALATDPALGAEAEVLDGGPVPNHLHPRRWGRVLVATAAVAVTGGGAFALGQHNPTPAPLPTTSAAATQLAATPPFTVHTRTLLPPATTARRQLPPTPMRGQVHVGVHMLKEWTGRGPTTFALPTLVVRSYRAVSVTCSGPGEVIFDDRTHVPCDPETDIIDPVTAHTVQTVKIQADSRTSWRVRFYDHDPTRNVPSAAPPSQHSTRNR